MTIKIILGSKSELKRKAVEHALQAAGLQQIEVICIEAESGVNPQPVGEEETWKGARNRAAAARAHDATGYAVGIESGIIDFADNAPRWEDRAVICMVAPDGTICDKTSEYVHVPSAFVHESRNRGYQVTIGQLIAAQHGCNHYDPHSFLTDGKWSRQKLITKALAQLFLDELPREGTHRVRIGKVTRHLPIREVAPDVRVALFNLLGDWELVEEAGIELAKLIPKGVDALLMPDGKAQALLHVLGRESRLPTFVARKERKPYMGQPVVSVVVKSITTDKLQELVLSAEDAAQLHGKSVAFVDDVVSTGGTLNSLKILLERVGAKHVATLAVFTEGKERKDVIPLGHLPLF